MSLRIKFTHDSWFINNDMYLSVFSNDFLNLQLRIYGSLQKAYYWAIIFQPIEGGWSNLFL